MHCDFHSHNKIDKIRRQTQLQRTAVVSLWCVTQGFLMVVFPWFLDVLFIFVELKIYIYWSSVLRFNYWDKIATVNIAL